VSHFHRVTMIINQILMLVCIEWLKEVYLFFDPRRLNFKEELMIHSTLLSTVVNLVYFLNLEEINMTSITSKNSSYLRFFVRCLLLFLWVESQCISWKFHLRKHCLRSDLCGSLVSCPQTNCRLSCIFEDNFLWSLLHQSIHLGRGYAPTSFI